MWIFHQLKKYLSHNIKSLLKLQEKDVHFLSTEVFLALVNTSSYQTLWLYKLLSEDDPWKIT